MEPETAPNFQAKSLSYLSYPRLSRSGCSVSRCSHRVRLQSHHMTGGDANADLSPDLPDVLSSVLPALGSPTASAQVEWEAAIHRENPGND
jgi:hypothetical protein